MKIFSTIIALLLGGCATKSMVVDYTLDPFDSPFARIQIAPTFENPIEYELTRHEPYMLIYSEYTGKGGYNWGSRGKITQISLSEEQHAKAIELLTVCLTTLPQNDQALGPDGTSWVLETTAFQYLKTIIWEPELETAQRGYSGLIELENYLNQLVVESKK
jgi:hypothetical protein